MATLKEIARQCGCSVAAVSKALNGMPDISPQTAKRIQNIAKAMGYVPNGAARMLRTRRSQTIGLMLFLRDESVWNHEYFSKIADSIQTVAEKEGFDLTPITCSQENLSGRYLDYCRYRGYDGLIIMSAGFREEGLNELINSTIPMVTIDYEFSNRSAVVSDNEQGMRDLTAFILNKGHRRIAYIHGESETSIVAGKRVKAFLETVRAANVEIPDCYLKPSAYRSIEKSAQATRELLALDNPPTCIIYPDDYAYVGGMHVLMEKGLRIPEDISVAGYDGIPLSMLLRPALTTVAQDSEMIGRYTGRLIVEAIRSPKAAAVQHILVPSRLVEGETVADLTESEV